MGSEREERDAKEERDENTKLNTSGLGENTK